VLKVELLLDVSDVHEGAKALELVQNALENFPFQLKADPDYSGPPLFEKAPPVGDKSPLTIVYTDGGCDHKRNGAGAWAFLAHPAHGPQFQRVEGVMQTTNNRMELMAVIRGLEALKRPARVELVTDSTYVGKGVSEWMPKWKQNGWRRRENGRWAEVKNEDLWRQLDALLGRHQIRFTHVRGHSGHVENERCDVLAVAAYQKFLRS
jgi:ribonuclease HI